MLMCVDVLVPMDGSMMDAFCVEDGRIVFLVAISIWRKILKIQKLWKLDHGQTGSTSQRPWQRRNVEVGFKI
jgi:hypothetical protein